MGIYTRDYYRNAGSSGEIPPVCKYLIIITVAVFVLQIFITRPQRPEDLRSLIEKRKQWIQKNRASETKTTARKDATGRAGKEEKPAAAKSHRREEGKETSLEKDETPTSEENENGDPSDLPGFDGLASVSLVQEWFELDTEKVVYRGQVWRLLTCAFCHERFSVWHILVNMLFLYWFGRMLEPLYGSREFLLFYLTAAVVASLCHIGLDLFTHHSVPAIGASGAVMAVIVLYAVHHPRETFYVFMMIPIEIRWLVLLYVLFDLHPVLLRWPACPCIQGSRTPRHLGGAAFGFLYAKFNLRLEDVWGDARRWSRSRFGIRRKARIYQPPSSDLEALVDKILEKVHQQGAGSLTDVEREVLRIAGERYKNRT